MLRQDVSRYIVDEMLFGGAPRKRYFWTNVRSASIKFPARLSRFTQAPVEKLEQEAVKLQSVVGVLKAAHLRGPVPVVPTQVLAVVTKNCRGGVGRDPTAWAPDDLGLRSRQEGLQHGNWVRLSARPDVIRLFSVSECAGAQSLRPISSRVVPARLISELAGASLGPCSIAHLLKCLRHLRLIGAPILCKVYNHICAVGNDSSSVGTETAR